MQFLLSLTGMYALLFIASSDESGCPSFESCFPLLKIIIPFKNESTRITPWFLATLLYWA
jgi:hypothetical protein